MKIVTICPYGTRTGGPEAIHQLTDALIGCGHDAYIWYVDQADIELIARLGAVNQPTPLAPRSCPVSEYQHYRTAIYSLYDPGDQLVFVLPEVMAHLIPMFQRHKVVLWWLSFDNSAAALSGVNFNFLRAPFVAHATQSHYAMTVAAALGLSPLLLTDYTVTPAITIAPQATRPLRVALNANHKVILNLDYLEQRLREAVPGLEVVRLINMSREEIYANFAMARLFIDLGTFPGCDRMAREAVQLGCNVIISGAGAGAHHADYPLPELYRPSPFNLDHVITLAQRMLAEPEQFQPDFQAMRDKIALEQHNFQAETARVFAPYR